MTIKAGDKMPEGQFMVKDASGVHPMSTSELFSGKTVVLFGVPGAFTPTCSAKHVPSFLENFDALKGKGVDTIACMSVNDAFVMEAWGKDQGVGDKIVMLADGSADYAEKLGLGLDLTARGMGKRCTRFAIVAKDGVAQKVALEENPGELKATGGDAMLGVV